MLGPRARTLAVPISIVASVATFLLVFLPRSLRDVGPGGLAISYDFHSFFLPKFIHGSRALAEWTFPVWNPYECAGVPFFAEAQPAVLYPPKLVLFGLLPPMAAYWAFLSLHYVALGLGFLLFLREQGIRGVASFVGATFWTFSVPTLTSNYHPTRIANFAFLPIAFLIVERLARRPDARGVAGLAVAVGLQLLAGYPEYPLQLAVVVTVHALVRWGSGQWTLPPWKSVPLFAAGFGLGGLFAAVQLVPLVEAAIVAQRDVVADAMSASLPPATQQIGGSALIGVPGFLVFTFVPLFERRARAPAAGLLFCILLGQGGWLLLRALPGFSMIRFPYLWFHFSPFFVAWLAALGCDTFLRTAQPSGPGDRARPFVVGLASVALFGLAAVALGRFVTGRGADLGRWQKLFNNVSTWPSAALGLGGAGLLAALAVPRVRSRLGAAGVPVAAGLLLLSHQASFPFGLRPAPVARPAPTGAVKSYLDDDVVLRGRTLSMHDIQYGYTITDRIPSVFGATESFVPWRFRRVSEHFKLWPLLGHLDWPRLGAARGFLDALDVQLIVAPVPFLPTLASPALELIRRSGEEILLRNPDPMGHAWVNHEVRVIESTDDARDYVLGRRFDPHREVVLEEYPVGVYGTTKGPRTTLPRAERRASSTEVEYDVSLARPGVLVLSESDYPGWEVLIDGRPGRILVADYVLRGVELAAGDHTVVFRYRPRSLWYGALGSGLGLLGTALLFVRRRRSRLVPPPAEAGS